MEKTSFLGTLFGKLINMLFEGVYNYFPEYSLFLTIIIFTILVKLLLLPLAIKQQRSMKLTKLMQPEMKAIQDKYKDKYDSENQTKMAAEMNAIYKKYGTNPYIGCLLSFIQLPIIIALIDVFKSIYLYINKLGVMYTTLSTKIMAVKGYEKALTTLAEAKKIKVVDYKQVTNVKALFSTLTQSDWTTLFNSLHDMSSKFDIEALQKIIDTKSHIETFASINLINRPALLSVSVILPIITILISYFSLKSSTKNQNLDGMTEQEKQLTKRMTGFMKILLVSIFFSSLSFPAAVSIYWSLSSIIQMLQQKFINYLLKKEDEKEATNNN